MQSSKSSKKAFKPFKLPETAALTPDHPDFYKQPINMAILTKYGRGIYIRHGNEDRCSSFFATLATIVNKLEMSFGRNNNQNQYVPGVLKCIRQGELKVYVLRRLNYMYICWARGNHNQVTLYGMLEFIHHQLMSCLTGQVNQILNTNQTYDPSINFGNTKTQHLLLHYAFSNGLYSLPVTFNALPTMHLPQTMRNSLYSLLKEDRVQGLQISILMTLNEVICVFKEKGIDIKVYDIFIFIILIQSQSSLFKSQIWYPICLPGVSFQSRVFCYINFLTDQIIHIMISDQADIFPQLSLASKKLQAKCIQMKIFERIHLSAQFQLINDPTLEKIIPLKHFMLRYSANDDNSMPQMAMSAHSYFGDNSAEFKSYLPVYAQLQRQLVTRRQGKKERVHIQQIGQYVCGYHQQGNVTVFFVASRLCEIQQCKSIINLLLKYAKQEELNLWIQKFV